MVRQYFERKTFVHLKFSRIRVHRLPGRAILATLPFRSSATRLLVTSCCSYFDFLRRMLFGSGLLPGCVDSVSATLATSGVALSASISATALIASTSSSTSFSSFSSSLSELSLIVALSLGYFIYIYM